MRSGNELKRGRAFGTKAAYGDRRIGIALDIDNLFIFDVDKLPASDRTVRANGPHYFVGRFRSRLEFPAAFGSRRIAQRRRIQSADLSENGPVEWVHKLILVSGMSDLNDACGLYHTIAAPRVKNETSSAATRIHSTDTLRILCGGRLRGDALE